MPSSVIERHGQRWDAVDTAFAGSTERAGVAHADALVAPVVDARDNEVGTLVSEEGVQCELDAVHGRTLAAIYSEVAFGGAVLEAQGLGRGDSAREARAGPVWSDDSHLTEGEHRLSELLDTCGAEAVVIAEEYMHL